VSIAEPSRSSDPALFATTRWSVVLAAGDQCSPESDGALSWLCERYWYPLYAYARHKGNRPPEAEDLVQGFFLRVLQRQLFSNLNAERGRFRAYLLACFHYFAINEWEKSQRQKRGGGTQAVPLDEALAEGRYQREFISPHSPEMGFDRAWALTLLERVFERLQHECEDDARTNRFAVMKGFLQTERGERSYEDAAATLGVTPNALRTMVFRLRQRFRDLLVDEIRQTVSHPDEVAQELRHLVASLGS
jgi:RNA polymerase sigma factor (sigma-70 family)